MYYCVSITGYYFEKIWNVSIKNNNHFPTPGRLTEMGDGGNAI